MPTYEYRCKDCGEHLEVVQSFRDDPLTECPRCSGDLKKVFQPIGIAFKGTGFYRNDARSKSSSSTSSTGSSAGSSSSPSSSSESSGSGSSSSSSSDSGSSSSTSTSSSEAKSA
jgi:putative FmdB family regulatory protein